MNEPDRLVLWTSRAFVGRKGISVPRAGAGTLLHRDARPHLGYHRRCRLLITACSALPTLLFAFMLVAAAIFPDWPFQTVPSAAVASLWGFSIGPIPILFDKAPFANKSRRVVETCPQFLRTPPLPTSLVYQDDASVESDVHFIESAMSILAISLHEEAPLAVAQSVPALPDLAMAQRLARSKGFLTLISRFFTTLACCGDAKRERLWTTPSSSLVPSFTSWAQIHCPSVTISSPASAVNTLGNSMRYASRWFSKLWQLSLPHKIGRSSAWRLLTIMEYEASYGFLFDGAAPLLLSLSPHTSTPLLVSPTLYGLKRT